MNHQVRTKAKPRCIMCGSGGEVLYEKLVDGLFGAPGEWCLKKCSQPTCGLLWLDPSPITEDLPILYRSYFTHEGENENQSLASRLRPALYGLYKGIKYIPSSIAGLSKAQEEIRCMFLNELKPGKVLDVGCGDGKFLNLMRRLNWEVYGLDFDPKAIESAKSKYGLDLHTGDLQSANFPDNNFDAVTLSHVIEHVPDPIELLKEVRRVLKPGGRLSVTTPNAHSFGHQQFQRYWIGLDPPRHLQVFTLAALGKCAQQAGLGKVRTFSTAANADIVIGGSYSIRKFHKTGGRNLASTEVNLFRSIKSGWLQYVEFFSLGKYPERGEEAVLTCTKELH